MQVVYVLYSINSHTPFVEAKLYRAYAMPRHGNVVVEHTAAQQQPHDLQWRFVHVDR